MTVSNTTRKAGPYNGNGVNLTFPFGFKVFKGADLLVVYFTPLVGETTLVYNSDYSVLLNPDQDATPGGSVTLLGVAPPAGDRIAIAGNLDYTQPLDITNEDGYFPQSTENALDRATMLVQQLLEQTSRAVIQPLTDTSGDPLALIAQIQATAAQVHEDALTFDERYLGPKATPPTTDNQGNALLTGSLYFDTVQNAMQVWSGAAWQGAVGAATVNETQTAGAGGQSVFTLTSMTYVPGTKSLRVYAGGIRQYAFTENTSTTITLSPAIPAGVVVFFESAAASASAAAIDSRNVGTPVVAPLTANNLYDAITQIAAALGANATTGVFTGAVMESATANPLPTGAWLYCNGQAVSRSTYANLFLAIGTTFGAGNGTTTFNVPDRRGVVGRGRDDGRGLDAGRVFGSYQADGVGAHVHPETATGANSGGTYLTANMVGTGHQVNTAANTGATTENRVKNIAMMYFIKT